MADVVDPETAELSSDAIHQTPDKLPVVRTLIAGTLMGMANLVPGVSGGTMVLVMGLYARFVAASADATRLQFTKPVVWFLVLLFGANFAAEGLLGETVAVLVKRHQMIAYSLFLGMTLAGTPILFQAFRTAGGRLSAKRAWLLILVGVGLMASLAMVPEGDKEELTDDYVPTINIPLDTGVGAAAYSAMVLPGVSGGTIKLAVGRYEPTTWAVGQIGNLFNPFADAAPAGQWVPIVLPYVGGALLGLVAVSNLLKWLLRRHEAATTAVLLGVLWGSVIPIWPFDGSATVAGYVFALLSAVIGFVGVYLLSLWKPEHG
jgi:putative membrane protein